MTTQTGGLAGDLAPVGTCSKCGSAVPTGNRFCGNCGAQISGTAAVVTATEQRRRIGGTLWTPQSSFEAASATLEAPLDVFPNQQRERSKKKRRRRKRSWYRRPLFAVPLLAILLLGGLAGTLAYRAQSTLDSLHRVSTPPAQITDSTQSDDGLPTGMVFDTQPARQALVDAGVLPKAASGGVFGKFQDAAGNVGDLASGAAIATGVKDPSKDAITVLIMGVDARPGAPIDIGVRPDAMMVLYLNPTSGACRGLAIPRDSLVTLPGYGQTKINHALMLAGIPYQQLVVEQFLNLKIDHYALIDFTGFKELVDAVGGVQISVPSELKSGNNVLFPAGPQTFDGDQALSYARFRGAEDVDVGRVRRQQQIIRGLVQVSGGRNVAKDVNQLLPAVSSHIRTDLDSTELIALIDQYRTQCSESSLELDTLQGNLYQPGTPDPIYQQPIDYVRIDQAVVTEKVASLTRP